MSFIPSIYKSAPQSILCNIGANAISAVTIVNTRLSLQGRRSYNTGGVVDANGVRISLTSTTNVQAAGQGDAQVLVEEYVRAFLRQDIQYGTVTIASTAVSGATAHGLTLGSKAFVSYLGFTGTRTLDGILALAESQTIPWVRLNGANVEAFVVAVDYAGGPGTVTVGYCLIDPK